MSKYVDRREEVIPVTAELIHETTSLCRQCKQALPARVVVHNRQAWMVKSCAVHGPSQVMLSPDADWYRATRAISPRLLPPRTAPKNIELGCPFDCGACKAHEARVQLPVVTITSACNLDCPICYVHNKNDDAYHMAIEEFGAILDHLLDVEGRDDILNLTGGEPLLHPRIVDFLALAKSRGFHRVTVCSNGLLLVKNEELVAELGRLGARVALSFDSFDSQADRALQGVDLVKVKGRVLDLLDKHGVDCTLIPVMTKGVNDHEIGQIIRHGLQRGSVRHIEVHTMTYTGQGGSSFPRSGRISMLEVLQRIEGTTEGLLTVKDFVPSPHAHSLCYQIAYLLCDPELPDAAPIPITRFLPAEVLYDCLTEHLYLEPSPRLEEALHNAINELWASEESEEDARDSLLFLRRMLAAMFPVEGTMSREALLRESERWVKAVYIHSHMDEDTFDVERAAQCCDSNCYADGTTIPVCNYNVLFRETEAKFMSEPVERSLRTGGRRLPVVMR